MKKMPKALHTRVNNLIYAFTYTYNPNKYLKAAYHLDYEKKTYRQTELTKVLVDAIVHFALTPSEFEKLNKSKDIGEMNRTAWSRISKAKKNKKGDYGELLLYLILTIYHDSPKFVTKVKLRSTNKEQIKGFDCAHFTIENNEVILWLGEAKFHKNFSSAFADAKKSIEEHFQHEYLADEISILNTNIEVDEGFDLEKLKAAITGKALDKLKIKVPILLTYDSAAISKNFDIDAQFNSDLESELLKHNKKIETTIFNTTIKVELVFLLFPLHSVDNMKTELEAIENILR